MRLLVEAAEICANQLDDENQAAEIYADALSLDPARIDLVDKLAAIRFRRGDWTRPAAARGAAGGRARRPRSGSPRSRPRRRRGSGISWRAPPRRPAICRAPAEAYGASLAAQPEGPQTLAPRRDLAALTFRLEQWPEAAAAHEALLVDATAAR